MSFLNVKGTVFRDIAKTILLGCSGLTIQRFKDIGMTSIISRKPSGIRVAIDFPTEYEHLFIDTTPININISLMDAVSKLELVSESKLKTIKDKTAIYILSCDDINVELTVPL